MPTLMKDLPNEADPGINGHNDNNDRYNEDENRRFQDESTVLDGDIIQVNVDVGKNDDVQSSVGRNSERNNSIETSSEINESLTFANLNRKPLSSPVALNIDRRETLDSNVSLDLSYGDNNEGTRSVRNGGCTPVEHKNASLYDSLIDKYGMSQKKRKEVRPWPNRDEYRNKYQDYVAHSIAEFRDKFPGKLRDYRSMTPEAKAEAQQRVLSLLTRLGISSKGSKCQMEEVHCNHKNSQRPTDAMLSPHLSSRERLLEETLSPAFSHSPCKQPETRLQSSGKLRIADTSSNEASEMLLSLNDGSMSSPLSQISGASVSVGCHHNDDGDLSTENFPVNNEKYESNSDASMEIVRRAPSDQHDNNGDDLSCETPEDQKISQSSAKRQASTSGKRGADLHRKRSNTYSTHSAYGNEMDAEMSFRLGRLSISPSSPTPPRTFFAASQSPINPHLTCNTPDDVADNRMIADLEDNRISWGKDITNSRLSDVSKDTLATNTPPGKYRSKKGKRRAFREVPANVALKDGAQFHLGKLSVKRTETVLGKSSAISRGIAAVSRRNVISFPDPLVRYSSRQKRALKEIYTWIRQGECDKAEGKCSIPAVGAFFSLSESQIIDLSLKLFINDSTKYHSQTSQKAPNSLQGNTLVVVRSKGDTAAWESALREGTGCSVFNHSTLPLVERIRSSSSEKACFHDVVLSTYDSLKSPDIAIPVSGDGHGLFTNNRDNRSWLSKRDASQQDSASQSTKKFSVLHRVSFRRIIFVDILGRKCYLAKGGTARAAAAVALMGDTRLVFFKESETDGSDPMKALRKSDKRAYDSISSVLHLKEQDTKAAEDTDDDEDQDNTQNILETVAMDLKDLC